MDRTWWIKEDDLDFQQAGIMALGLQGSHLVKGPPGSGKTNLAILRGNYHFLSGAKNISVVCFTRTLVEFLRTGSQVYDFPSEKIVTSRTWMRNLLRQYGHEIPQHENFMEERRALAASVGEVFQKERLGTIQEAILLDETQDFLSEELLVFKRAAGSLFAVADDHQKIYKGGSPFTDEVMNGLETHTLTHHYRSGLHICEFADKLAADRPEYVPLVPRMKYSESKHPSRRRLHSGLTVDKQIDQCLSALGDQLDAYPNDMVGILALKKEDLPAIENAIMSSRFGDVTVVQKADGYVPFVPSHRICVCTIHGSKGLEFRSVHALGLDGLVKFPNQRRTAFTAVTRAKTMLDLYWDGNMPGYFEQAVTAFEEKPSKPTLKSILNRKQ